MTIKTNTSAFAAMDPVEFSVMLRDEWNKEGDAARLSCWTREVLLDLLLDKYSIKICEMNDFQLLSEAKDWGVF